MGFALWTDGNVAWSAGTSEYRAMGAAVISDTDVFRTVDFRNSRRAPPVSSPQFVGHFASLGQMNAYLGQARRRRQRKATTDSLRAPIPFGARGPR
jgi:hypothetical protein